MKWRAIGNENTLNTYWKYLFCKLVRKFSLLILFFVVVAGQSASHVWLFATPWTAACQTSLSLTISWSLPKFMSIELVMPSSHLILCCPLLLPSIYPSIRVFSKESTLHIRWPKYWKFSISTSSSNEYSGLISFRIDWLISLLCKGFSRVLFSTTVQNYKFFGTLLHYGPSLTSAHDYW